MIPARTMRLVRRLAGTAAVLAVTVMLVVIYIRSSGKGGQVTLALPASATRTASGSGAAGGGAASAHSGGGGGAGGSASGGGEAAGGSGGSGSSSGAEGGAGSASASSGPPLKSGTAGSGATGTFTGSAIHTIYGPVQVAVAEERGRIVDVKALQLPTEHALSLYISERVAPLLRTEALRAQSAEIGIVSGATFTSEGFATSLQNALSQIR